MFLRTQRRGLLIANTANSHHAELLAAVGQERESVSPLWPSCARHSLAVPPSGTPSKIFFFPFSPWLQLPSLMLLCSVEDLSSSGITPLKQTNYENELLYCFYAGLWSACPHIKCEIKPASKSFVMSLFRKMCL